VDFICFSGILVIVDPQSITIWLIIFFSKFVTIIFFNKCNIILYNKMLSIRKYTCDHWLQDDCKNDISANTQRKKPTTWRTFQHQLIYFNTHFHLVQFSDVSRVFCQFLLAIFVSIKARYSALYIILVPTGSRDTKNRHSQLCYTLFIRHWHKESPKTRALRTQRVLR